MKATDSDSGIKEASAASDVKGQMEATPRPWKTWAGHIYAPGDKGGNVCSVSDPRAKSVVGYREVRHDSADLREAYANAELICRAVNNFDALVEAVQFLQSQVRQLAGYAFSEDVEKWIAKCDAMNCADRALANARSGQSVLNVPDSSGASSSPKSAAVTPTKGTN